MDGSLPPKLSKISALILLDKCIHPLFGFPGSTSISGRARTETRLSVAPHGEEDAGRAFGSRNAGTGFLLLPVLATRKAHFWAADAFNKCGINRSVISQLKGEAECGSCEWCCCRGDTAAPWCSPKAGAWRKGPCSPARCLPEPHTSSALLSQPKCTYPEKQGKEVPLGVGSWANTAVWFMSLTHLTLHQRHENPDRVILT